MGSCDSHRGLSSADQSSHGACCRQPHQSQSRAAARPLGEPWEHPSAPDFPVASVALLSCAGHRGAMLTFSLSGTFPCPGLPGHTGPPPPPVQPRDHPPGHVHRELKRGPLCLRLGTGWAGTLRTSSGRGAWCPPPRLSEQRGQMRRRASRRSFFGNSLFSLCLSPPGHDPTFN